MTRELKFRAWDKLEKEMFYDANSGICIWLNGVVSRGEAWETAYHELMQFTGLRDKNGKEIYEGDILGWSTNGRAVEVVWKNYGWSAGGWSLQAWEPNKTEVIGNIYESPDLLTNK